MGKSQDLYKKAKTLIPGGTQLLSKRPEMFLPENWPAYYSKTEGCEVTDLDGNNYVDMTTMGIGTCILGAADPDVNNAVKKVIDRGSMSTLNAPEEVELAELLCELHPWADMVRYTRTGGEAMAVAVRIARAASKKNRVLFCGYHGWHDWYLSSNISNDECLDGHLLPGLEPNGIARELSKTAVPFNYNDTAEFLNQLNKYDDVGVVVLETIRNEAPSKEFIEAIVSETRKRGITFVVDEITSGWRLNVGGAHLVYDFEPDMAVFAKGISNGYPMAAVIGNEKVMQAAQDCFISSTYWTDRIGPTAALATIQKMKNENVSEHIIRIGELVQAGWEKLAEENELNINVSGIAPLSHFTFCYDNALELKTLFTQEMLKKGYLASTQFYPTFAHKEKVVCDYLKSVNQVFELLKMAITNNTVTELLQGPICHSGFKRLN